jgi:hypothetical protein
MALVGMEDAFDADNCEPFTILRYKGNFVAGGYQEAPTTLAFFGVISNPGADALALVPEGDRVNGSNMINWWDEIKESNADGTSDVVVWNGRKYRVARVWDYSNRNYWYALAVRMEGV